ncbi:hypothetical protein EON83_20390 [bacterium]|nr:MAG: hypothetical protein EON83_20390 [bacterium]
MPNANELTTPSRGFSVAHIDGRLFCVTIKTAADLLGISERRIYDLLDKREGGLEEVVWNGRSVEYESLVAEAARRGIVIPAMGEVSR